ncbi:MAG: hypothetical protein KTR22_02010 [Flavobacteriaceae bacterium]|nr:hypothetical protein [Flavobacteriaceae bacterium]
MHLIEKNHIEISCSEESFAHTIKEELGSIFEHELYPKLETLLDRYDVVDRVWKIEQLSVDIPSISMQHWKRELVDNVLYQIEEFLKQHTESLKEEDGVVPKFKLGISRQISLQEILVHYLKNGTIPANSQLSSPDKLFEEVEMNKELWERLKLELGDDAPALLRWSLNVPNSFKVKALEYMGWKQDWERIKQILQSNSDVGNALVKRAESSGFGTYLFWTALFQQGNDPRLKVTAIEKILDHASDYFQLSGENLRIVLRNWKEKEEDFALPYLAKTISYLKDYLSENEWKKSESPEKAPPKNEIEDILEALQDNREVVGKKSMDQGHYIQNAGLVILHPFLVPLFQKLGYLEETRWESVMLQHRAVLITHYLTYSENEIFESELLFNKILCGVKPTDTVLTEWEITEAEKEQCESLLEAVIEHWKILKDTSVPTLQETFLQRHGKLLEYQENKYELTVEQKGLDILLDQLPWGIGTVKTPWMEHFLSCYWN